MRPLLQPSHRKTSSPRQANHLHRCSATSILPVPLPCSSGVFKRLGDRLEFQGDSIHAVALPSRLGSVVEHVAEMTAAAPAMHFRSWNEQAVIVRGADSVLVGAKKLGQPVPLSNLVSERKSGRSQAAQANRPGRCSLSSALEYGRSVPRCRSTWNCSGVKTCFHSASVFDTSNFSAPACAPSAKRFLAYAAMPARPMPASSAFRRDIISPPANKQPELGLDTSALTRFT